MFLGTYSPRLDTKGRIILPAKFREELSAGLVLTRGQERCLYVFSAEEFERIHELDAFSATVFTAGSGLHACVPVGRI